jgi:RNA polymerase sigma-70 factor (ECF subfamily)
MAMSEASSTACQIEASAAGARSPSDRLQTLVSDHHAFLWRSLRRLGVADGDVDDAVQQVFLVAFRRLSEIAKKSERAFLFQTALRVAADWRRAHKRRCEQAGLDLREVPDSSAGPEELMDRRRARALLDRVLGALPMDLRAVFVLFELEELTMMEIATMSDIPPGTVASRLRRARQAFQEAVRTMTSGPGAARHERGGA